MFLISTSAPASWQINLGSAQRDCEVQRQDRKCSRTFLHSSSSVVASVRRDSNDNSDTYYEVHDGITELEATGTAWVTLQMSCRMSRPASRSVWSSSRVAKAGS